MEYKILFTFCRGERGSVIELNPNDGHTRQMVNSGLIAPAAADRETKVVTPQTSLVTPQNNDHKPETSEPVIETKKKPAIKR